MTKRTVMTNRTSREGLATAREAGAPRAQDAEGIADGPDRRAVPPTAPAIFGPPRGTFGPGLLTAAGRSPGRPAPQRVAALLPAPLVDRDDPAAVLLAAAAPTTPQDVERVIAAAPWPSRALRLTLVLAHVDAGDAAAATAELDALATEDADDWRQAWFRGLTALVAGRVEAACAAFDTVHSTMPGEAAPMLALAAASECAERDGPAARYYALLAPRGAAVADAAFPDAAFGLARVRMRGGDRAGALEALDTVPDTSGRHIAAQLAAVEVALSGPSDVPQLQAAAARVQRLRLDPGTSQRVRTAVFEAAVELARGGAPGAPLLGCPWDERSLRLALEASLRASARITSDPDERVALVDRANTVRPRTWV
jgi:serine/threonine-protein kinase PknG